VLVRLPYMSLSGIFARSDKLLRVQLLDGLLGKPSWSLVWATQYLAVLAAVYIGNGRYTQAVAEPGGNWESLEPIQPFICVSVLVAGLYVPGLQRTRFQRVAGWIVNICRDAIRHTVGKEHDIVGARRVPEECVCFLDFLPGEI